MINTDPIYQEWTIQRDRQQWAQDIEQRQKKKQPKHSTQKSKKMINTDPIYQEQTIQRDRQQTNRETDNNGHKTQNKEKKNNQNTQHRKVKR